MRHEATNRLFERAFSIEQVALVSGRSKRETPVLVTSKAPIRIGTASFWCGKCGLRTAFLQILARIADYWLPLLRSVASSRIGDQAADKLRFAPRLIRLASSGYKRKAFAEEMLRKSASLNAG